MTGSAPLATPSTAPSATSGRRRLSVFGATGSIGSSTLDVIRHLGGREAFDIVALTGMGHVDRLAELAVEFAADVAVTADPACHDALKDRLAGTDIEAAAGPQALAEAGGREADWVMAGIVGMAGLAPTLAAARRGADIALANKECLVAAGDIVSRTILEAGGRLLPVDSEHNAIHQVLDTTRPETVERIILTASGGPFRDWPRQRMARVNAAEAAKHPKWSMGLKISIDSASLFNKALEMIEARHLFGVAPDQIEVVVHPQSIIHSMVGYRDGTVLAQLGVPDMRTAIAYALTYPVRADLPVERLDFARLARLDFEPPDAERFPALSLARRAMERGGLQGAVMNGAKETALDAFIAGRVGFLEMAEIVEAVMDDLSGLPAATTIDDVYAADGEARRLATVLMERRGATAETGA